MSDGPPEMHDHEETNAEVDPGEPVALLAGFEQDTSSDLLTRIRRAILRRTAAAQLTTFSWNAPLLVMKEFWLLLMEQFTPKGTGKDGRDGRKTV
jgi:hypothetical protein